MRSGKTIILLAVLILIALALMLRTCLGGSGAVTEEQKVIALVKAIAKAAETHDIKSIRAHLSRRYKDPSGRDYDAINQILRIHYLRKGKITVYIASQEVTVEHSASPMRATIKAKVVLTRGGAGSKLPDIVPESGDAITFDVIMEQEDGEWMMISADWKGLRNPRELLQ